jgi:hypothetical protein
VTEKLSDEDLMQNKTPNQSILTQGAGSLPVTLTPDGNFVFKLDQIQSVGIRNIADVEEHRINRIVGTRSHMVRFFNGGVLTYAYNDAGQLMELCATKLMVIVSKDNEVSFLAANDICEMTRE